MKGPGRNSSGVLLMGSLALAGCATTQAARMHSAEELNAVALRCGLALGELFQDESEKRLLFFFRPGASAQERSCVTRWARPRGLRPVFVNAIQFPES
jgi:hypothetical protein